MPPLSDKVDSQYVGNYIGGCCDAPACQQQSVAACAAPATKTGNCQQAVDAQCVGSPMYMMFPAPCPQAPPKIEVKPPKAIEDMKLVLMRRDVMWQFRFSMKDLMRQQPQVPQQQPAVDQKLVATLTAEALEQLTDTKMIPPNIILNRVSLMETSNDSFVEFGVDADWIKEKGFVTSGGQRFTGYVADEVRVFHPKERVLYHATEEDRGESYRLLPLMGMTKEELVKGVTSSKDIVTVPTGTYLYNLLCSNLVSIKKSATEAGIVIGKASLDGCISSILADMELANSHVTRTANMDLKLCIIKPANFPKKEMCTTELLNALVGVHAHDEHAKQYYLDKVNKINVVMRLEYFVPQ
jgi:hypothetical protein